MTVGGRRGGSATASHTPEKAVNVRHHFCVLPSSQRFLQGTPFGDTQRVQVFQVQPAVVILIHSVIIYSVGTVFLSPERSMQ